MAFEIDVMLSFAEKDNEAKEKNQSGWVDYFKRFLELMLYQVLGEKPRILMKSEFDSLTASNSDNVAVMVVILSNEYIKSGRCLDTLESFYKNTESKPGKNRIFKVIKNQIRIEEQPPRIRELLPYEMFQQDIETGAAKEYTDFFSQDAEKHYWMKMVDLAYDIHESLIELKQETEKVEIKNVFKRKIIYLAETGHDLTVQRNIIKRELLRHGYIVLPGQTLPQHLNKLEESVKQDLENASMSIHLIGNAYGEIPEGADKSVVEIQNKLAADKSRSVGSKKEIFSRLIWVSPDLKNASERQRNFIDNIKRDVEAQEGAEILQTPLEDFKNIVREELLETSYDRAKLLDTNGKTVYLIHDKVDSDEVKSLIDFMEKSGYQVLLPQFEGELLDLRQRHINNLRSFDAALIYKGKVNEQWVRMKLLDLLKAPGFGRKKPIKAKAIMAAPGSLINKDVFELHNLTLIESDMGKSIDSLKVFLQEIN